MRIFCKRTFMEDDNIYFIKNKTYEMLDPKDYEEGFGVYKKVKSEKDEFVPSCPHFFLFALLNIAL